MGRAAGWAVGLLMNYSLWRLSWSQQPSWYYRGLEAPFGKTLDPSQVPGGFALSSQALFWYAYWLIISMLGVIAVSSIGLFLQRFLHAQQSQGKEEAAAQRADPEEAALMEALHLLDAVMEKTWCHPVPSGPPTPPATLANSSHVGGVQALGLNLQQAGKGVNLRGS